MATTILTPTALEASTFTGGTIADIDEGVTSPDANWLTLNDTAISPTARVSFPTPPGTGLTGTQTFRIYVRKYNTTGGGTPTVTVDLYESGSLVTAGVINLVNLADSTAGQTITGTWSHTALTDTKGTNVEMLVTITNNGGGPNRRSGELGAVDWVVSYAEARKFFFM